MSRILIAWQLGNNFGHLTTDLPIASCLREEGHQVSFVVPSVHTSLATQFLSRAGFAFSSAPEEPMAANDLALASYAEIMRATGFGDQRALERLAARWSRVFEATRAEVIVADHAPMAVVAARCSGIPSVLIGNGFTVPPLVDLLPSIRPWEPVPETRLRASEAAVLDRVNTLGARSGKPPLRNLSQLFSDSGAIVATTSELDPYGPRAQVIYVGPVAGDGGAGEAGSERIDWSARSEHRVFAYLRATVRGIGDILTALEESEAQVICAMPGASAELESHFEGTRLTLVGRSVPLAPLLAEADAVVGYGGSGLISAALLVGLPMLLIPQNPEQYLGSAQVAKLGAGVLIGPRSEPGAIARGLGSILGEASHREAAQRYADAHCGHDRVAAARRAAGVIAGYGRGAPT